MNNYKLQEGLNALDRIKLLMEYDMSKTSTENGLYLEQGREGFSMDRQGEALKNTFGITSDTEYKNRMSNISKMEKDTFKSEGSSISEVLDKVRSFFFTPGGMTAQIVLSVLGAEIGLPIAFEVLDIAIVINDFYMMVRDWKTPPQNSNDEGWFIYQFENNHGFINVMEDILIFLTMGVVRLAGKGAKGAYKLVRRAFGGKPVSKVVDEFAIKVAEKKSKINKLPKPIREYCNKKLETVDKGIQLLKNPPSSKQAAKSVVKNIPKAAVMGTANYVLIKYIDKKIKNYTEGKKQEAKTNILSSEDKDYIKYIVYDNPSIFYPIEYEEEGFKFKRDYDGNFYELDKKNNKWVVCADENTCQAIKVMFDNNDVYSRYKINGFSLIKDKKGNVLGFNINKKIYYLQNPNGNSFLLKTK